MNINYAISPYPSLTQDMVAKVYEASAPSAEVASFTIVERDGSGTPTPGAGHQVPVTISFNGLDAVTHVVRLYTASATLLHEYDVQPTVDIVTLFDPIFFRIGDGDAGTPLADQPLYSNIAFDGLTSADLSICQEGLGFLLPGIDYELSGAVVALLETVFEDGQRWYIFKKPSIIATPVNDSVVGKGFGGFVDVVADIDYSASHLRKLIRMSGTGNYTFPALASVPIGYNHVFTNFGAESSTPRINFLNGNLLYGATPKSFLIIPFGATCWFTWDGSNWNCTVYQVSTIPAPVSGDILYAGNVNVGDIATYPDKIITVTHGQAISGAYKVFPVVKSASTDYTKDSGITFSVREFLPDSFKIGMRDIYSYINDFSFDYIIVKA